MKRHPQIPTWRRGNPSAPCQEYCRQGFEVMDFALDRIKDEELFFAVVRMLTTGT